MYGPEAASYAICLRLLLLLLMGGRDNSVEIGDVVVMVSDYLWEGAFLVMAQHEVGLLEMPFVVSQLWLFGRNVCLELRKNGNVYFCVNEVRDYLSSCAMRSFSKAWVMRTW